MASSELVEFVVGFKSIGVFLFPAGEIWFISMTATEDFPLYFGISLMEKRSFVFFCSCAVAISAESGSLSEMGGTSNTYGTK